MSAFSIANGTSTTFTDTTPDGGFVIDFASLDNSLNVQVNGVDLFVGGPSGAPNELQFQIPGTLGQTVRFADGDQYETDTPAIWQLENTSSDPVLRLVVNPDGTAELYGIKENNGPLEPLELTNGLSVNTGPVQDAWNESGSNTVVVDQQVVGPTHAVGSFSDVPCFCTGTLIATTRGTKRVESLKIGDIIETYDGAQEPIRWIGSCRLTEEQVRANPKLHPIEICAGALGEGFPTSDLRVSRQHRVLISSKVAMRMFGVSEILVPAHKLLPLDGVNVLDCPTEGLEYWHILFDSHQIVWSNGTPTESFYTGSQTLKSLSHESRAEIEALFPEICKPGFEVSPARYIPQKGMRVKKLVQRHKENATPMISLSQESTVSSECVGSY